MQVFKQFLSLMPHCVSTCKFSNQTIVLLVSSQKGGRIEEAGADLSSAWRAQVISFHFSLYFSHRPLCIVSNSPYPFLMHDGDELATSFLQLLQIAALRLVSNSIPSDCNSKDGNVLLNRLQLFGAYPIPSWLLGAQTI